jgi:large subunit ribosomal protein L22
VETVARARYIRISARKARLVIDMIRGRDLDDAQQILDFSDRGAARVISKVLRSAAANAENNNGLAPEALFVSRAFVDEGPTLKRFRPRAMGRATRINKRTCHITIVLDEREPDKAEPKRRRLRRGAGKDKEAAARDKALSAEDKKGKEAEAEPAEEIEEIENPEGEPEEPDEVAESDEAEAAEEDQAEPEGDEAEAAEEDQTEPESPDEAAKEDQAEPESPDEAKKSED